ncbi:MAG TPA: hypothetical protein VIR59_14890 [Gaiellaceae bacterium]
MRAFLLVVVCAMLLAGCGSKPKPVTKAQYEQQLQRLGADLVRAGTQVGQRFDIASFNEDVQTLQDQLRSASKELKGVKPPADAQAANQQLADSFHDLADALEPVKDARRKSLPQGVRAFNVANRSAAAHQGRAAVRQLQRRGYDIGQMSRF